MDCNVHLALPSVPASLACVESVPSAVFCNVVGSAQMSSLELSLEQSQQHREGFS